MMRRVMSRGLGMLALVLMAGCGGPVDESMEAELSSQEQELPMCKVGEPQPCPDGYTCIGKTCYPDLAVAP